MNKAALEVCRNLGGLEKKCPENGGWKNGILMMSLNPFFLDVRLQPSPVTSKYLSSKLDEETLSHYFALLVTKDAD